MSGYLKWALIALIALGALALFLSNEEEGPPEATLQSMDQISPEDEIGRLTDQITAHREKPITQIMVQSIGDEIEWVGQNPAAHRSRKIELNPDMLKVSLETFQVGDVIEIELFDGEIVSAVVRSRQLWGRNNETLAVLSRFADDPHAYMTLSSTGGVLRAWVHRAKEGKDYQIRYDVEAAGHVLLDIDMSSTETFACATCINCGVNNKHKATQIQNNTTQPIANVPSADSPASYGDTVFGVMVVYTPAALAREGSLANIEANISEAINKGNIVLENSLTEVQLELVHSAEVNYTESGSAGTDLDRLEEKNDGIIDDVHNLRDQYAADFVTMFIDTNSTGGLANRPFDHNSPESAFSIVRVQQADTTSYTTIHELAHNMGIGHSKTQSAQAFSGSGIASYAAGWQWTDGSSPASIGYCSVMTYENFDGNAGNEYDRVPHFSNPSVNYLGNPTGDAADGDAARVIREGRALLAAYRNALLSIVDSFPYTQGFETDESVWINDSSFALTWTQGQSGSTPSGGTGPGSAHAGSQYAYTEASFLDYNDNNSAAIYADFDFTLVTNPQISFYYHMFDNFSGRMGDLYLEVSTDGGSNWTTLVTISGDQGNTWNQSTASLFDYAGQAVRLRFRGVVGSEFQSDIAIDSIAVEDLGPPANFADHVTLFYPGISDSSLSGDPDGDFVVNFLEYALGRSLTVAESNPPIIATYNESTNDFVFSFHRGQETVRYVVESTNDLNNWTNAIIEWDSDTNPADLVNVGEVQSIAIPATDPERFVRLNVSE